MDDGYNGKADSDNRSAIVHRQGIAAKSDGRSPAKSSSASEEEGQFEERDRAVKRLAVVASASPARQISPSKAVTQESSAMTRERSAPGTWRQRTPVYPDRLNNHSWRSDASEPSYNSGAGRGRGLEGIEAEAGPSRRPIYRTEDRMSHLEPYTRHRENLQHYDRYDAANRSMSIGSYDERYPNAHYDDRAMEWSRERARERDYQWDRARESRESRDPRESAWTRSQYARPSSPSRPSPTPHSRGMSGSWSGPTSPSSSWRERWSSGSNVAASSWDRERHDRDRDRERTGYWQSREILETGPDAYQRRVSNPRSPPPLPAAREHSRSRLAKAPYGHLLQSNSSPTPSIGRSPDLQRNDSNDLRRESDPRIIKQLADKSTPPQLRQETAEAPPPPTPIRTPSQVKIEPGESGREHVPDEADVKEPSFHKTEGDQEQSEALVPIPAVASQEPLEAITEEGPRSLPQTVVEVISNAVRENKSIPIVPDAVLEDAQEARGLEEIKDVIETVDGTVELLEVEQPRVAAAQIVEESHEAEPVLEGGVLGAELTAIPEAVKMGNEMYAQDEVTKEDDMGMDLSRKREEVSPTIEDIDMEPDEQYDASGDVTIDSIVTGDDIDQCYPTRLRLDEQRLHDYSDDPSLPTPKTLEEQDRLKRAGIVRLLQERQPDLYEVKRVFSDNKKILASKALEPLESAIYGEFPRKNHTEPWLDEDDEEIKSMRYKMTRIMKARQKRMNEKITSLKSRYRQLNKDWQRHCAHLYKLSEARESQNSRTLFGGTVTISGTSASLMSQGAGPGQGQGGGQSGGNGISAPADDSNVSLMSAMGPSMTRANRRQTQTGFAGFGDAVRSEAEFLEILASLENADMQDPNMRAARTTATEPDMILNPDSKAALLDDYDDDNGFVADPMAFYFPDFDPDYWTEDEKMTFERRYALFPKQFGKIAASLPHKTAKQCVSYYYLTKHAGHDYKSLTAGRNRDRKRKTRVKPKKGRGSALMADLKGGDDLEEDDLQSPGEGFMGESTSLISARSRPSNASSRARILTSSTLSGDLGVVVEGGEDDSFDVPSGRKRRVDEIDSDEKKSRPGNKTKRAKSEKKVRSNANVGGAVAEEMPSSLVNLMHGDPDLAAAEALGALAGAASAEAPLYGDIAFNRKKKASRLSMAGNSPARIEGAEDGAKRSRQTTSSYWSVAERNEFLRSLATFGKDWDAIASTLSTKSAAQARNYYARNVEESEFVEAVTMARDNASLDLIKRQDLASAFILRRASLTIEKSQQIGAPQSGYFATSTTPTPEGNTPTARGLNINSLLNEEISSNIGAGRRASINEWFSKEGKEDDSNDDTEDEEQEQATEGDDDQRQERETSDYFDGRGRSSRYEPGYPSAVPPSRHLMNQVHRRSPSILSSMPPPSAFIGTGRYQLPSQQRVSSGGQEGQPSPLSSFHYVDSMSRSSTHSPSEVHHPSAQQQHRQERFGNYERESTRSSWSPAISTPTESMPMQHRHGSWPHAFSPSHLAPPLSSQASHTRDDRSPSSLSPYPRPNTTHGSTSLSSYPFPHPTYERPHSSGHTSSIRSISPNPPTPRLPPINQSLFSPRHDSRDSPH